MESRDCFKGEGNKVMNLMKKNYGEPEVKKEVIKEAVTKAVKEVKKVVKKAVKKVIPKKKK